jgi:hypothetical protein
MNRAAKLLTFCFTLLLLQGAVARGGILKKASGNGVKGEYIVVLKPGVARLRHEGNVKLDRVSRAAEGIAAEYGAKVLEVFENALPAFIVALPDDEAERLAGDRRVEAVTQAFQGSDADLISSAVGDCYQSIYTHKSNLRSLPSSSPQALACDDPDPSHDFTGTGQAPRCIDNWGLDRIDQASVNRDGLYTFDRTGRVPGIVNVVVYVLDTGINPSHDEFRDANGNSRVLPGYDAICAYGQPCPPPSADCAGHGTHVAGIIGGRTYGVAKGVFLYPVRIVSCGGGYAPPINETIVRALDWIAGQGKPGVANWSGGNTKGLMSDPAVIAAAKGVLDNGILIVQSAGNQSSYSSVPGGSPPGRVEDACPWTLGGTAASGAFIVGGTNEFDARWVLPPSDPNWNQQCGTNGDCGSNVGACIDIWAPAGDIISASYAGGNAYCRLSGTSMAAPHVTGAAALYLQAHPTATPAQIAQALFNGATVGVLATSGFNSIGSYSTNRLLYSKVP